MQNTTQSQSSFFGLFRELKEEARTFLRQEAQLAKTEIGEKISRLGRRGVVLVGGGLLGYAGVIVFLTSLGLLLAFALENTGLDPIFAGFVGLAAVGLAAIGVACLMIAGALKRLSHESLAPEKTMETLKRNHSAVAGEQETLPPEPKRSSQEIQASVFATEHQMGETVDEIRHRLSPRYMNQRVKATIQTHPYSWNLVAIGTGLAGGLMLKRRARNHAPNH